MVWLVDLIARLVSFLILLRVVVSWFDMDRDSEYLRLLFFLTEPILAPLRRLVCPRGLRFDLSPLVAVLGIELLRGLLVTLIRWGGGA